MRQLDLFGSFFETPAKEEKTEDNQPDLKKETVPPFIVNKETPSFLVDITEEMQETEVSKDAVGVIEDTHLTLEAGEHSENLEFFPLPESIISHTYSEPATIEQSTVDLPVNESDAQQQSILQQDDKEQKTSLFDKSQEAVEDEKNAVQAEDVPFLNSADTNAAGKKEPQKRGRKSLETIEAEADLTEVPEDEILFKKQYYPISEVAKWFRVNASLLRFWEKEFDILKPKKNGKGDRLFRPEDVKNLQLIYQLLRQRKYTIEGAKEYIKTHKKKADAEMQLANTLLKFKSFLLDLKANLQC